MPTIQGDNIADLVALTLRDLGELKWTDIASSIQDFVFLEKILKKDKVGFHAGYGIQWNVQATPTNQARWIGLYQVDNVNATDQAVQGNLPWRHIVVAWAIDETEVAMNREPRRIVDLVKFARSGAMISLAEAMESAFWNMPAGTSDALNPMGIPYWLVPSTTQGFNGLNPFGFTAGAGNIDSTKFANWANYTDAFTDFTKTDMIRRMRRAATFCKFISPSMANVPSYNTADPRRGRWCYYMTYACLGRFEEIAEQQNDNLGKDLASMDGEVMFRRNPVVWAPKLEGLTATTPLTNANYASVGGFPMNPIYGIDHGVFRPIFLSSWYMREFGPRHAPNQHTVLQTFVDCVVNLECRDRRRNFLLQQGTSSN